MPPTLCILKIVVSIEGSEGHTIITGEYFNGDQVIIPSVGLVVKHCLMEAI